MSLTRLIGFCLLFFSCEQKKNARMENEQVHQDLAAEQQNADTMSPGLLNDPYENPASKVRCRLKYPEFTLIIHGFSGYEVAELSYTDGYLDIKEAKIHRDDSGNYFLQVSSDTLHLYEQANHLIPLWGNMIEIISPNKKDSFNIACAYSNGVAEVFTLEQYRNDEDKLPKTAFHVKGYTDYYSLRDSGRYFFWSPEEPKYEEWEWKVAGFITKSDYRNEVNKYKDLYGFRDTEVTFAGGEGGDFNANLTKNGRFFNYYHGSYLFRVQRFRGGKLMETRYVNVEFSEGC